MIKNLVQDLPEVYQPIFGHPELSTESSRPCVDRLLQIERIYVALENFLNRPLKVLDLGCAQGYFCFNLGKHGAIVHGVDYLDKNIVLCNSIANENADLKVSFSVGRIENVVASLRHGEYDLVLGLSVFHHLVHENGVRAVKTIFQNLAELSGVLVLEMALQSEPLYWAASQPEDPRELIQDIGFVHLVTFNGTHLSSIPRPLYIASQYYWIFDDVAWRFERWSFEPHGYAKGTHGFSRRYFFSKDCILKHYRLDHPRGSYNKSEYLQEVKFLHQPPSGFCAPKLITSGAHESEAWLAMERLPGQLLLDLILSGEAFDKQKTLLAVLRQLVILESVGLYHNDVRAWNVLIDKVSDGVYLIDYGSISADQKDCVWPGNLFLSFLIFVRELATGLVDVPDPLRKISISPYGLPEPFLTWAHYLWQLPMGEWSFKLMLQTLMELQLGNPATSVQQQPLAVWMNAIEEALQTQIVHFKHQAQQAEARAQQAESKAIQAEAEKWRVSSGELEGQLRSVGAELEAARGEAEKWRVSSGELEGQLRSVGAELEAARGEAEKWRVSSGELEGQLEAVYNSKSWKISTPFRWSLQCMQWTGRTVRAIVKRSLYLIVRVVLNIPIIGGGARKTERRMFPLAAQKIQSIINDDQVVALLDTQFLHNNGTSLAKRYWQEIQEQIRWQWGETNEDRY